MAVMSLAAAGCGTVRDRPQTVGPLPDVPGCGGLALQLSAPANVVQTGRPAAFNVTIRNTSDQALWLPKNPQQGVFWTYPNGRHDGYILDREATHVRCIPHRQRAGGGV